MISIRHKNLILVSCILEAIWLLVAQATGSLILLLPCLACFLFLVCFAAIQGVALPVLMFFLPFAPLLKIYYGTISFFTLALLCVYVISAFFGSKGQDVRHFIPALLITALSMLVKLAYNESFSNSYFLFIVTLLFLPFIKNEILKKYDFLSLTLFFVLGITIAAITSQFLIYFPSIMQFINRIDFYDSVRLAGYYGDPNFYSAHISAALAGTLILLLKSGSKKRIVALVVMVLVLLYCGLLSISKSFLLISVCLFLLWISKLLFTKGKISLKFSIVSMAIVAAIFLLSSTIFTDSVNLILSRFSNDNSLSDFTTKRTDIWLNYFKHFIDNPAIFLFGHGYSSVLVYEKAAHNTLIQLIFQFGIVGFSFYVLWLLFLLKKFFNKILFKINDLMSVLILLVGCVGPWLALDMLFLDEFFLIPIYVISGILFLNNDTDDSLNVQENNADIRVY